MPEKSRFTFKNGHTSSCHYWIFKLIFLSLLLDSLNGAQLDRRGLKGAMGAAKTMGAESKGTSATQGLKNGDFWSYFQPKTTTDPEFENTLNDIRMKSKKASEIDLNPNVKLSKHEVAKVASEMDAHQKLLDDATHLTDETFAKQDKFLREVRVKKDHLYRHLESTSKKRNPTKKLLKEAKYSRHQSVRDASRSLKLHHIFNRRLKGFWQNLLYFLKGTFSIIGRATWGKNHYAMTLVESLRRDPQYALSNIKQKAAVEEIFQMASRRGNFDDFEIDLLDRLMKIKNHHLSPSENKRIDGLSESFMLRHLEPQVFTTARQKWIKELSPTSVDINREARLMMLRKSDVNNEEEITKLRNIVKTGKANRDALREKINNLDQIIHKINNQQALYPEDRTFLLTNVEKRFQAEPFNPESSRHHKRLTNIWNELLPVVKAEKSSEGVVPQPTNVIQIEFGQAAMQKGSMEREEIIRAIMEGRPIEAMGIDAYLTSTQLDALRALQSVVKPLGGDAKGPVRVQIRSDIDAILSRAKTPSFRSDPEFLSFKRQIYQKKLRGVLKYLQKKNGQFGKQSEVEKMDASNIIDWYSGKVRNRGS